MPNPASRPTSQTRNDGKRNKVWTRRIVFAFFIFIAFVVLLESPLTRIRHVTVSGNTLPEQVLVKDSGLTSGMSLWQVNSGAIAHRIMAKQPLVEHVTVHTDYLSGTVTLHILQKTEVAVFEQNGNLYSLLNDGTVYQRLRKSAPVTLPIVESSDMHGPVAAGTIANVPGLVELCKQLGSASNQGLAEISQIVLDQYGDVTMYLDNGFSVQTGASQLSSTLATLGDVIAYFTGQGYGPGLIDMSGKPPYHYTPFQAAAKKKKGVKTSGSVVITKQAVTSSTKGK